MSLSQLPPDLLRIISYLLSQKSICALQITNKINYAILNTSEFWRTLFRRDITSRLVTPPSFDYKGCYRQAFSQQPSHRAGFALTNNYDRLFISSHILENYKTRFTYEAFSQSSLIHVARNGYLEITRYLLDLKVWHEEALNSAVCSGQLPVISCVYEAWKAQPRDPEVIDTTLDSAFATTLRFESTEGIIDFFLDQHLDINDIYTGESLLTTAMQGHLSNFKHLLKRGITLPSEQEENILRAAALSKNLKMVRYLFEDLYLKSMSAIILDNAISTGHVGIVRYLLDRGFPLTPELRRSCFKMGRKGHLGLLRYMIEDLGVEYEEFDLRASLNHIYNNPDQDLKDFLEYLIALGLDTSKIDANRLHPETRKCLE